ncbi:hypothetical protein [Hydrocarboniclastica marina]|nr:hypothetical protein [Hydrocarboniclastica marina]
MEQMALMTRLVTSGKRLADYTNSSPPLEKRSFFEGEYQQMKLGNA